ncbi:MAG: hypothetical protein AB8C84_01730 [Oligoflexales bacterium]
MKHVNEIENMIAEGLYEDSHDALDTLLSLGPQNVNALKLRAQLYAFEGKFQDEMVTWRHIIEVDREDEEAILWFQEQLLEEREGFVFTDEIPSGGRRFITYPRSLIHWSMIGLVGCASFVLLTQSSDTYPIIMNTTFILSAFSILVILPLIFIFACFVRSLQNIDITPDGVTAATRLKTWRYEWGQIKKVHLSYTTHHLSQCLYLIFEPHDISQPALRIDLTPDKTSVRTRSLLINEITKYGFHPEHSVLESCESSSSPKPITL